MATKQELEETVTNMEKEQAGFQDAIRRSAENMRNVQEVVGVLNNKVAELEGGFKRLIQKLESDSGPSNQSYSNSFSKY